LQALVALPCRNYMPLERASELITHQRKFFHDIIVFMCDVGH